MEPIAVTVKDSSIHLEGFPSAIKLAKLDGPKAARLAGLALHRSDLSFASGCLAALNKAIDPTVRSALWRCAIIYYAKCFDQSESRAKLDAKKVFAGCEEVTLLEHQFFEDFRDKNLVHDENAFSQCVPAAVINRPEEQCKIAKVVCATATFDVLGQDSFANLTSLIGRVNAWLEAQFDALCNILAAELEAETYDQLLAREDVQHRAPTAEQVAVARTKEP
jgi:hypothetical protein